MAGIFGDYTGIGTGIRDQVTQPLFLAGLGLATGGGWGGAMQGAQMGQSFQKNALQQAEDARRKALFPTLVAGADPKLRSLLEFSGPMEGGDLLTKFTEQDRAEAMLRERQAIEQRLSRERFEYQQRQDAIQNTRADEEWKTRRPLLEAQAEDERAQAEARKAKVQAAPQLEAKLRELGFSETDPEWDYTMVNGKLPAKAFDRAAAVKQREIAAQHIEGGLKDLYKTGRDFDKASFENALGPYQAAKDEDLGMITGPASVISRGVGEAMNWVQSGKNNPTQVRDTIKSKADLLSTAIKPLIRGPGEGPWTDADQAQLNRIVGNLEQSRDKKEFNERLNSIRDSLSATYGLKINFDALKQDEKLPPEKNGGSAGAAALDRNAIKSKWGLR